MRARFAEALAERLSVGPEYVIAAYEDPLTYIHKERELPVNVDPEHNDLDDPEERERLRKVFSRGLGTPTGFVLPLARAAGKDGPTWQSGLWMLRARHLFLIPGDSPVGLRLPMKSLPAGPAWEVYPIDPMLVTWPDLGRPAAAVATPSPHRVRARHRQAHVDGPDGTARRQQQNGQHAPDPGSAAVRTALTVEAREGKVWTFLPPVASAADFVDLVDRHRRHRRGAGDAGAHRGLSAAVRSAAAADQGDARSRRHRGEHPPARSWRELVANTTTLYEQARQSRLGTEKFMLDGRHTGTGGGNHVVLGGPTPADSPFLRRPDLLRSFIGYWLNHPSLSYLFSGVFIGPTSQAPRVDETRADAVYELEIALSLLEPDGAASRVRPPWLVDRIFRNLLVDVTGNTHRAEFCIDKLYSPDSAIGPPRPRRDARVRDAAARAHEPGAAAARAHAAGVVLAQRRTRRRRSAGARGCTTASCCPHYVERDFAAVIADLHGAGYAIDGSWFAPHLEFRFPVYGRVVYDGVRRGAAAGDRAVVRARRRAGRRRHRALRGLVGGAAAGAGARPRVRAAHRRVQRRAAAAAAHRHRRRVRLRRPLPRLAAPALPAPHDPRAHAARLRRGGPGRAARHRRLHLPRRPPGRTELRDPSCKLERGGSEAAGPVLRVRPHAGAPLTLVMADNREFPSTLDLRRQSAAPHPASGA